MFIDDLMTDDEPEPNDGTVDGYAYPNLFSHQIKSCIHTFFDLNLLLDQGYVPFDGITKELVDVFKTDEIYLNGNIAKSLYVKDFEFYKMLVLVSTLPPVIMWPPVLGPDLEPITGIPYYILVKALLNPDNSLVKTLEDDFPSILLYKKEERRMQPRTNVMMDAYYCFYKHHYSFVDIEEHDYTVSKYCFTFRDYDNNIIAQSSHFNSEIKGITLKNSVFYHEGVIYNHEVLFEMDVNLECKTFEEILHHRSSMNKENIDLLSMHVI